MRFKFLIFKRCLKSKTFLVFYVFPSFISLFLFFLYTYPALKDLKSHQELLVSKRLQYRKYLSQIERLRKQIKTQPQEPEEVLSQVFSGSDPYIIVASLQKEMEKIPEISIRSFRIVRQIKKADHIKSVLINFNLETDAKGLAELIWLLENYPKKLKISRINITSVGKKKSSQIKINLELEALFREEPVNNS